MFARVSSYDGPAGLSDEDVGQITKRTLEDVMPAVRQMGGFRGILSLLDRGTGKAATITLWESEADMKASEEAANQARAQAASIANEEIRTVERYEVTFQEMP
jgi:heme-degrading monooxygenase HmoA